MKKLLLFGLIIILISLGVNSQVNQGRSILKGKVVDQFTKEGISDVRIYVDFGQGFGSTPHLTDRNGNYEFSTLSRSSIDLKFDAGGGYHIVELENLEIQVGFTNVLEDIGMFAKFRDVEGLGASRVTPDEFFVSVDDAYNFEYIYVDPFLVKDRDFVEDNSGNYLMGNVVDSNGREKFRFRPSAQWRENLIEFNGGEIEFVDDRGRVIDKVVLVKAPAPGDKGVEMGGGCRFYPFIQKSSFGEGLGVGFKLCREVKTPSGQEQVSGGEVKFGDVPVAEDVITSEETKCVSSDKPLPGIERLEGFNLGEKGWCLDRKEGGERFFSDYVCKVDESECCDPGEGFWNGVKRFASKIAGEDVREKCEMEDFHGFLGKLDKKFNYKYNEGHLDSLKQFHQLTIDNSGFLEYLEELEKLGYEFSVNIGILNALAETMDNENLFTGLLSVIKDSWSIDPFEIFYKAIRGESQLYISRFNNMLLTQDKSPNRLAFDSFTYLVDKIDISVLCEDQVGTDNCIRILSNIVNLESGRWISEMRKVNENTLPLLKYGMEDLGIVPPLNGKERFIGDALSVANEIAEILSLEQVRTLRTNVERDLSIDFNHIDTFDQLGTIAVRLSNEDFVSFIIDLDSRSRLYSFGLDPLGVSGLGVIRLGHIIDELFSLQKLHEYVLVNGDGIVDFILQLEGDFGFTLHFTDTSNDVRSLIYIYEHQEDFTSLVQILGVKAFDFGIFRDIRELLEDTHLDLKSIVLELNEKFGYTLNPGDVSSTVGPVSGLHVLASSFKFGDIDRNEFMNFLVSQKQKLGDNFKFDINDLELYMAMFKKSYDEELDNVVRDMGAGYYVDHSNFVPELHALTRYYFSLSSEGKGRFKELSDVFGKDVSMPAKIVYSIYPDAKRSEDLDIEIRDVIVIDSDPTKKYALYLDSDLGELEENGVIAKMGIINSVAEEVKNNYMVYLNTMFEKMGWSPDGELFTFMRESLEKTKIVYEVSLLSGDVLVPGSFSQGAVTLQVSTQEFDSNQFKNILIHELAHAITGKSVLDFYNSGCIEGLSFNQALIEGFADFIRLSIITELGIPPIGTLYSEETQYASTLILYGGLDAFKGFIYGDILAITNAISQRVPIEEFRRINGCDPIPISLGVVMFTGDLTVGRLDNLVKYLEDSLENLGDKYRILLSGSNDFCSGDFKEGNAWKVKSVKEWVEKHLSRLNEEERKNHEKALLVKISDLEDEEDKCKQTWFLPSETRAAIEVFKGIRNVDEIGIYLSRFIASDKSNVLGIRTPLNIIEDSEGKLIIEEILDEGANIDEGAGKIKRSGDFDLEGENFGNRFDNEYFAAAFQDYGNLDICPVNPFAGKIILQDGVSQPMKVVVDYYFDTLEDGRITDSFKDKSDEMLIPIINRIKEFYLHIGEGYNLPSVEVEFNFKRIEDGIDKESLSPDHIALVFTNLDKMKERFLKEPRIFLYEITGKKILLEGTAEIAFVNAFPDLPETEAIRKGYEGLFSNFFSKGETVEGLAHPFGRVAYIYPGPLPGSKSELVNYFASLSAHEIGHLLSLKHTGEEFGTGGKYNLMHSTFVIGASSGLTYPLTPSRTGFSLEEVKKINTYLSGSCSEEDQGALPSLKGEGFGSVITGGNIFSKIASDALCNELEDKDLSGIETDPIGYIYDNEGFVSEEGNFVEVTASFVRSLTGKQIKVPVLEGEICRRVAFTQNKRDKENGKGFVENMRKSGLPVNFENIEGVLNALKNSPDDFGVWSEGDIKRLRGAIYSQLEHSLDEVLGIISERYNNDVVYFVKEGQEGGFETGVIYTLSGDNPIATEFRYKFLPDFRNNNRKNALEIIKEGVVINSVFVDNEDFWEYFKDIDIRPGLLTNVRVQNSGFYKLPIDSPKDLDFSSIYGINCGVWKEGCKTIKDENLLDLIVVLMEARRRMFLGSSEEGEWLASLDCYNLLGFKKSECGGLGSFERFGYTIQGK